MSPSIVGNGNVYTCAHLMRVRRPEDCVFCHRDQLKTALKGLSAMYTRAWDRVDGGLVMLPPSIPEFEAAHAAARVALGEPLDEDTEPQSAPPE